MPDADWIKQTLTRLRKLDRTAQRTQLQALLAELSADERTALQREITARRERVAAEQRALHTRGQGDPARKQAQKTAMLARYDFFLHLIAEHAERSR